MFRTPDTHYAKGPAGNLAYQVVGDGPIDLVIVPGWFSHVDLQWEFPACRAYIGEFASFARVIMYDKLGKYTVMTLEQLLPMSFGPDKLLSTEELAQNAAASN